MLLWFVAAQGAGISFVRVGNEASVHSDVKQHCLSELAKKRFQQCMLCCFISLSISFYLVFISVESSFLLIILLKSMLLTKLI